MPELEKGINRSREDNIESISPIPSPPHDYEAPSPEADEMELELPEESGEAKISLNQPLHGQDSGSDLNSRLDSMMNTIPGTEVTQK